MTGATGFLGGWIVRALLQEGAEITALIRSARPESQFARAGFAAAVTQIHGAVEDAASIAAAFAGAPKIVFHLAALVDVQAALQNPEAMLRASIGGTLNILEQIRRHHPGALLVVASSDKAYGAQQPPFSEDMMLNPVHPYEIGKATQDQLAQVYGRLYGLNIAVTRCGNFFGGYDFAFERIIPYTIRQLLRGERVTLRSDGDFTRDFLYVEEAARVHLMLAERLAEDPKIRGQAFNFSHEVDITIRDLVRRIAALMGVDVDLVVDASARAEIRHLRLDTAKAREVLGWRPRWDFDAGLQRTIDDYAEMI